MAKLPRHELAKVLAERTLGRVNTGELSQEVAAYLLSEHRTADLEPLLRDVMHYRAEHGIVEVIAVSAHQLSAAARADIVKRVQAQFPDARNIIVSEELSSDVVGGVRLEFPDQQLDLTVRAKLRKFKQLTTA